MPMNWPAIMAATNRNTAGFSDSQTSQRRSGAQTCEPPANAEQGCATDQGHVQLGFCGQGEFLGKKRMRLASDQRKANHGHYQGTAHDQHEREIPVAGDVQKPDDPGGVDHLGDRQSQAEQNAA
jgi:hypothetical protein